MQASVTAVLGPTNTGKTHYAIDRMLGHESGVIGLPLRLLAREIYDRIVALRGPSVVALVTGEERIVPPRARYWVATTEAMPEGIGPAFLALDEVQLAADADRGHVFTDRLLHARGRAETLLLGADTMRGRIAALVPGVRFEHRERFSKLSWTGARKISRVPARSAIVAFSAEEVYAIAEVMRRLKGGAAVVMGALSPRTRNAQVELFQNGDVDYLVATDAIGMGLNLDIDHVAFAGTVKFDGRRHRHLNAQELAQIAGRAGRFTRDGSFGTTGEAPEPAPEVLEAIENHRFAPVRVLQWRNPALDFASPEALIAALETMPGEPGLQRAREADDLAVLKLLSAEAELRARARDARGLRLLWAVCQLPDFRKIGMNEHAALVRQIFLFLGEGGCIPSDWLAAQIRRIDRMEGTLDDLARRLAFVRTWTYAAQREGWVSEAGHWRGETRAVEDRLSDALHQALTRQFVDRRTSVLLRRLREKEALLAEVNDKGEVTVEGEFAGRLEGFRFRADKAESEGAGRTLRQAAVAALAPVLSLKADRFYNAPDPEIDVTEQGGLMWGDQAVGRLVKGADVLSPGIEVFVDEEAGEEISGKVRRRLGHWLDRKVAALLAPLTALKDDSLSGMARGIAFQLAEGLGVLDRAPVAAEVKGLDQEARAALRKLGVRFGQFTLFMPLLLKPAATRLRLVLWSLARGLEEFPVAPPPGLVTVPPLAGAPEGYYPLSGYRLCGERAVRLDILERLADMIRVKDTRAGFEASPEMLSVTGLSGEAFAGLMTALGYAAEKGERPKAARVKAAAAAEPAPVAEPVAAEESAPAEPAVAEPAVAEPVAAAGTEAEPEPAPAEASVPGETEVFWTYRWAPRRPVRPVRPVRPAPAEGDREARPRHSRSAGKPKGKPRGDRVKEDRPERTERPPRAEKPVDPDNPFAALLALKLGKE